MTTFSEFQPNPGPSTPESPVKRPELIFFVLCLLLGLGTIFWRARTDANTLHLQARSELAALCSAIEPDINAALAAAEAPAVLARNGGRLAPDFQRVRARLDKIRDFSYALYIQLPNAQQLTFLKRGYVTPDDAEQAILRAHNRDFYLALQAPGSWYNKVEMLFEFVVVLLFSGLVCLLTNALRSRREIETTLSNESRRLTRETAAHKQLQEEFYNVKHEATVAQSDLKQAQTRLLQAEGAQTELKQTQAQLQQVEAALKSAQSVVIGLTAQIESLDQAKHESDTADQAKIQHLQATLLERESRINALLSTRETAEQKMADLEQINCDLKAGLTEYQHAEAQAAELKAQLGQANAELQHHKDLLSASIQINDELSPSAPSSQPKPEPPAPANDDLPPWEEEPCTPAPEPAEPTESFEISEPLEQPPLVESIPAPADNSRDAHSSPASHSAPPETLAPATILAEPPVTLESSEPKPVKAKRKRSRRDNQIPLFVGAVPPAPEAVPTEAPTEPTSSEPAIAPIVQDLPLAIAPVETKQQVTPAQLRKAVNNLLPLLAGADPGAQECFMEYQDIFRAVSSEEAFLQFEQWINQNDFTAALEFLKKAAKRNIAH